MVTNILERLTTAPASRLETSDEQGDGLFARALGRVGQAFCALQGHDSVLHFEENRVLLRCTSCGYDSPGWEVGHGKPRVRFEGDARRHLITNDAVALRKTA